jgi:hypothetical protein
MKLLALYGLKWNPFLPELPTEALLVSKKIESFCWRVENALVLVLLLLVLFTFWQPGFR